MNIIIIKLIILIIIFLIIYIYNKIYIKNKSLIELFEIKTAPSICSLKKKREGKCETDIEYIFTNSANQEYNAEERIGITGDNGNNGNNYGNIIFKYDNDIINEISGDDKEDDIIITIPKGLSGKDGPTGKPGPRGDRGNTGKIGIDGVCKIVTGLKGLRGDQGEKGSKGDVGLQGLEGRNGLSIDDYTDYRNKDGINIGNIEFRDNITNEVIDTYFQNGLNHSEDMTVIKLEKENDNYINNINTNYITSTNNNIIIEEANLIDFNNIATVNNLNIENNMRWIDENGSELVNITKTDDSITDNKINIINKNNNKTIMNNLYTNELCMKRTLDNDNNICINYDKIEKLKNELNRNNTSEELFLINDNGVIKPKYGLILQNLTWPIYNITGKKIYQDNIDIQFNINNYEINIQKNIKNLSLENFIRVKHFVVGDNKILQYNDNDKLMGKISYGKNYEGKDINIEKLYSDKWHWSKRWVKENVDKIFFTCSYISSDGNIYLYKYLLMNYSDVFIKKGYITSILSKSTDIKDIAHIHWDNEDLFDLPIEKEVDVNEDCVVENGERLCWRWTYRVAGANKKVYWPTIEKKNIESNTNSNSNGYPIINISSKNELNNDNLNIIYQELGKKYGKIPNRIKYYDVFIKYKVTGFKEYILEQINLPDSFNDNIKQKIWDSNINKWILNPINKTLIYEKWIHYKHWYLENDYFYGFNNDLLSGRIGYNDKNKDIIDTIWVFPWKIEYPLFNPDWILFTESHKNNNEIILDRFFIIDYNYFINNISLKINSQNFDSVIFSFNDETNENKIKYTKENLKKENDAYFWINPKYKFDNDYYEPDILLLSSKNDISNKYSINPYNILYSESKLFNDDLYNINLDGKVFSIINDMIQEKNGNKNINTNSINKYYDVFVR